MSHHIVETKDLHYVYSDGTVGLNGVSFRITHGESVALVGENGAGKSTLLQHLSGCLLPGNGRVQIGDDVLCAKSVKSIRRTVGMLFQNPDDQLFMPTVFEDVAFGLLNAGMTPEQAEKRVTEALALVGAAHLVKRPPYKLSQGEKRVVAIATVWAMTPQILVMDEPSSNLDPSSRRKLINLLLTFDHTKIVATHDLDMAADLCERVIVLHQGKVMADGPAEKILTNESLLQSCSLEKPLRLQLAPVFRKFSKRKSVDHPHTH